MENKVKITVNGQSFEVPMDPSFITGLMGSMGMMMPRMVFPRLAPMPAQPRPMPHPMDAQSQPAQIAPMPLQTSHERLEENFFKKIEEDLESYKDGSASSMVERILIGLISLHKRVKMLENPRRRLVLKRVMKPVEKPSKPKVEKPKAVKPMAVKPKVAKTSKKKPAAKKK